MVIRRAVVHKVVKEQHKTDASIQWKDTIFQVDQRLQQFIGDLDKVYQKHGGKSYGIFEKDMEQYPFQVFMNEYLQSNNDHSFYFFSKKATELFKKRLSEAQASTGGYLFFLHYNTDSGKEFLAAIILNDRIGYAIQQETLELIDVINLNIEHLSMGARIDIREYQDRNADSYLSFIRGRKKVRNYFTDFIGCTDYQTSRKSTELAIDAFYAYCEELGVGKEQKRQLENKLFEFFRKKSEVDLDILSKHLFPETASAFYEKLQDKGISDYFDPDRGIAKQLINIRYEGRGLIIEFTKEKLDSQEIQYDDKGKELRIKDVDGKLGESIRHGLGQFPRTV